MSRPDITDNDWPGDWPVHRLSLLLAKLEKVLPAGSQEAHSLLSEAQKVTAGLDDYLTLRSTPVPSIVEDMVKATEEEDWERVHREGKTKYRLGANMCAGSYEASVLRAFAGMSRAGSVLEVGMFTGTSTLAVALMPLVKRVVALEVEDYLDAWSRKWFDKGGVGDKVEVRIGDARKSLDELKGQSFDLVRLSLCAHAVLA